MQHVKQLTLAAGQREMPLLRHYDPDHADIHGDVQRAPKNGPPQRRCRRKEKIGDVNYVTGDD